MMNLDSLSAAQTKAIENGGTNNAVIGNSLVKRGIMADAGKGLHEYRFSITNEYIAHTTGESVETVQDFADALTSMDEEQQIAAIIEDAASDAHYAETIGREEDAQDDGAHEAWQLKQWDAESKGEEIIRLCEEYATADAVRAEEIEVRLRELGSAVPIIIGAEDFRPTVVEGVTPKTFLASEEFHAAILADDAKAAAEILNGVVPEVQVRDPKETRYAHVNRWTDDNLDVKYGILRGRLARRTLRKADRMQAERQCQTVETELLARGRRDVLEAYANRSR